MGYSGLFTLLDIGAFDGFYSVLYLFLSIVRKDYQVTGHTVRQLNDLGLGIQYKSRHKYMPSMHFTISAGASMFRWESQLARPSRRMLQHRVPVAADEEVS